MASGGAERNLLPVTLPDTFGKSQSLLQWKGKVLLLNFWATWCAPCLEEIPLLIAKQIQYGADGLQIVGIAIDRLPGVQRFMDDLGVNYPVLLAEKLGMNIMRQYGNRGALPFSILFNRQGQLVQTRLGIYKAEELESEIKKLL